mmetsp:Transcript_33132/g.50068  ORF Transcript_33132/g.50068 Transcript_33132/m.50068 type:complete len:90 (+) Transcript_33132:103-372(+)|eukprot:CAMPEP_0194747076 /NCGR_PEP_ID=MMETSP0323_2-20130528/1141_1 /TAXON_ID=2866 ORGANISM="Crypthecodinium cohnii, Strain Seligo" /NCGR_SAMPLE_ID=MMETSP0323_2 /ASSEMBLY_ACC=CAM_ASM_000346 /LENGTH=89 /DNA_ID=CAMNT_0039660101 /DNA_START=37 /DNA_END=306 /DNA_ORIENTATION=-
MGAIFSIFDETLKQNPRLKKAKTRSMKLLSTAWWLGGNLLWTFSTSMLVLAMPVFFEYERECQLFDQMAQQQQAQIQAAAAMDAANAPK